MEGCVSNNRLSTIKDEYSADTGDRFTIVGPEYIAMMAGEAAHPRKDLKRAFKTIYLRFGIFFIGGALACGIVIVSTYPTSHASLDQDFLKTKLCNWAPRTKGKF